MTDNSLGGGSTYQLLIHEPDPHIVAGYNLHQYDLTTWSRWSEVIEYAEDRGIRISQAINELVNSGLSHQQ